jgi:putative methyltransferase (TIGR04325 family)
MSTIKSIVKDWSPPLLIHSVRRLLGKGIRFEGNYQSWDEAAVLCTGYDSQLILDKVLESTLKVKHGEAVFERDSVLFDEIQYSWPITAALMWAAAKNNGELHVLDFGGSLGSSYFQNKKFISNLRKISWSVVEQDKFVKVGRAQISDNVLKFYSSIDDCCTNHSPNIVLVSSVLQYLIDPFNVLTNLAAKQIDLIIIDRTPFSSDSSMKIKIQHVPAEIYSASYPCWFFSRDDLIKKMNFLNYKMIECFDAIDDLSDEAKWKGLIFEKVK